MNDDQLDVFDATAIQAQCIRQWSLLDFQKLTLLQQKAQIHNRCVGP